MEQDEDLKRWTARLDAPGGMEVKASWEQLTRWQRTTTRPAFLYSRAGFILGWLQAGAWHPAVGLP